MFIRYISIQLWYWNIKIKAGINFTNILRKPWKDICNLHISILYIESLHNIYGGRYLTKAHPVPSCEGESWCVTSFHSKKWSWNDFILNFTFWSMLPGYISITHICHVLVDDVLLYIKYFGIELVYYCSVVCIERDIVKQESFVRQDFYLLLFWLFALLFEDWVY